MMKRLTVVSAGLGQPSSTRLLADRLGQAVAGDLRARGVDVVVETLELRDTAHDVTTRLVNGFSTTELDEAVERLTGADAAIVVTPVFAASYSGLFKSFFDVLEPDALTGLPMIIAATGGSDRHALVLEHAIRPLFGYLHAAPVTTAVYGSTADWGRTGSAADGLVQRIHRAAGELADVVERAAPRSVRDPFRLPAGFDPAGLARTA